MLPCGTRGRRKSHPLRLCSRGSAERELWRGDSPRNAQRHVSRDQLDPGKSVWGSYGVEDSTYGSCSTRRNAPLDQLYLDQGRMLNPGISVLVPNFGKSQKSQMIQPRESSTAGHKNWQSAIRTPVWTAQRGGYQIREDRRFCHEQEGRSFYAVLTVKGLTSELVAVSSWRNWQRNRGGCVKRRRLPVLALGPFPGGEVASILRDQ